MFYGMKKEKKIIVKNEIFRASPERGRKLWFHAERLMQVGENIYYSNGFKLRKKKTLKSILYTKITHKKLYKTTEKYIKCNHTPKFKGGFVC